MENAMKKFTALSLVILLVIFFPLPDSSLLHGQASETAPDSLNHTGEGVIWRSPLGQGSSISQLEVAYLKCDQSCLTPGRAATWTAQAEGGSGKFLFQFILFFRAPDAIFTHYMMVPGGKQGFSPDASFTRTITRPGTYVVRMRIRDSAGQELVYLSQKYTACSTDALTEKVREVAALCNAAATGDYGKALYLHNWLINNATYSSSGPCPHEAQGVLLHGSGVCDGYALAYQMLLSEVGIDSISVSGTGDGGPHAWNLVRMGGSWYHVDVTWDDNLGYNAYFGMNDTLMRRDHSWKGRFPACTETAYYYPLRKGEPVFRTPEELKAILNDQISRQNESFKLYYMGEDAGFRIADAVNLALEGNQGYSSKRMSAANYFAQLTLGYAGIPAPAPGESTLPGDANGDHVLDIRDLVNIIECIVSGRESQNMANADANGDGEVDIRDLVWIIERIVAD